jgi:hypothetical protein
MFYYPFSIIAFPFALHVNQVQITKQMELKTQSVFSTVTKLL